MLRCSARARASAAIAPAAPACIHGRGKGLLELLVVLLVVLVLLLVLLLVLRLVERRSRGRRSNASAGLQHGKHALQGGLAAAAATAGQPCAGLLLLQRQLLVLRVLLRLRLLRWH